MTEPKKYRTDWTIEEVTYAYWPNKIKWYKGTPDVDNVHFCATIAEAESEIDNAIIMEQEQVIEKFRDALRESTEMLLYGNFSIAGVDLVRHQIKANQNLINAFKP